ncbi:MAG: OmpA family protein [Pseudomonadota bacterium]
MGKHLAAGLAITGLLALAACDEQGRPTRAVQGGAVGAATGALAGLLVGGNDRRNALVGAGIGLLVGTGVGAYLDAQERALRQDLQGSGAVIQRVGDRLIVTLPQEITFDVDSATVKPAFLPSIGALASNLREYPSSYLDVIGHTDSTGSTIYNQGLSERRARSVESELIASGVNPVRLVAYGRGETVPVGNNATPEGRARNRRVELVITPATQG